MATTPKGTTRRHEGAVGAANGAGNATAPMGAKSVSATGGAGTRTPVKPSETRGGAGFGAVTPTNGPSGAAGAARTFESKRPPTHEAIRLRAFQIFQSRRGGPGDALSDWLAAERELTGRG